MTDWQRFVALLRLLPRELWKSWLSGIRWRRMQWHCWRYDRHKAAIERLRDAALADRADIEESQRRVSAIR